MAHINECVIEAVRQYPYLYNISDVNYHVKKVKANAWRNVGDTVGLSGRTVQRSLKLALKSEIETFHVAF